MANETTRQASSTNPLGGPGNPNGRTPRHKKSTLIRVCLWIVAILVVLVVAVVLFVAFFDWNRARPFINHKVSDELGRPFAINGDLTVKWEHPPQSPGWRGWLPWPHVSAHDITLGNTDWARTPNMATVDQVDFDIGIPPLLAKQVLIPVVTLKNPSIDIERKADGRNNYTFATHSTGQPSAWNVDLHDIVFATGKIGVLDEGQKADLQVTIDTLGNPIPFGEVMKQTADTARQQSATAVGRAGAAQFTKAAEANEASQARAASAAAAEPVATASSAAAVQPMSPLPAAGSSAASGSDATSASMASDASGSHAAQTASTASSTAAASGAAAEGVSAADSRALASASAAAGTPDHPKIQPGPYKIGWKITGKYKGESVVGDGKLGEVLSLRDATQPFPLQADVKIGDTRIALAGTLTDPMHLAALDLRLWFQGQSFSHLYPLTGVTLPDSPPFATEGRLIGQFKTTGDVFRYEDFTGRVGGSDLNGTLTYEGTKPRPKLTGDLVSHLLRFDDLAPLVGADSNASKAKRGDVVKQPADKAIPVEEFRTDRWKAIDADVKFTGEKIVRDPRLPITHLYTHVVMDDGHLRLIPLRFGVAGGEVTSDIDLDGRSVPLKAKLSMGVRSVKLKQLFPTSKTMQQALGDINGDGALSATGNSPAQLAATSNGEIKLLVQQGAISAFLMEAAGLNVANAVVEKLFGNHDAKINCAASDFVVTDGVLDSKVFVVDTDDAVINVDGTINLKTEGMDLGVHPHTKGFRVFSLRSPLYVKGTFKNPHVGVDAVPLALRGGGAILLGLINPFAALIPLLAPSNHHDTPCMQMLAQMRKQPVAPPAGLRTPAGTGSAAQRAARGTAH